MSAQMGGTTNLHLSLSSLKSMHEKQTGNHTGFVEIVTLSGNLKEMMGVELLI